MQTNLKINPFTGKEIQINNKSHYNNITDYLDNHGDISIKIREMSYNRWSHMQHSVFTYYVNPQWYCLNENVFNSHDALINANFEKLYTKKLQIISLTNLSYLKSIHINIYFSEDKDLYLYLQKNIILNKLFHDIILSKYGITTKDGGWSVSFFLDCRQNTVLFTMSSVFPFDQKHTMLNESNLSNLYVNNHNSLFKEYFHTFRESFKQLNAGREIQYKGSFKQVSQELLLRDTALRIKF